MSCVKVDNVRPPPELDRRLPTQKDIGLRRYEWSSKEIQSQLPIDILLVTATDHEFNSCYSYIKQVRRSWCPNLGMVDFGEFGDQHVTVTLIRCQMGPLSASIVVKNATEYLEPKVVLFVGICATVNCAKAKLGDVVISAKLATYASKKVTADGTAELRGIKANVSRNMGRLILSAADGWQPPLKEPSGLDDDVQIHRQAVMLSGPELVDNDERRQELLDDFPDAIGLEMEGEGLYAAAHDLGIEWAVIKGVSDFANGSKKVTEDWQPFASTMAASVVYNMFQYADVIKHWSHYKKPGTTADVPTSLSSRMLLGCLFTLLIALLVWSYISFPTPLPESPDRASNIVPTRTTPIEEFLRSIAGTKDGRKEYNGRTIEYSVSGRVHSFKEPWVYDATAKDVETGVFVKKKHFETADEAVYEAIEELVKQLKERKILQV